MQNNFRRFVQFAKETSQKIPEMALLFLAIRNIITINRKIFMEGIL